MIYPCQCPCHQPLIQIRIRKPGSSFHGSPNTWSDSSFLCSGAAWMCTPNEAKTEDGIPSVCIAGMPASALNTRIQNLPVASVCTGAGRQSTPKSCSGICWGPQILLESIHCILMGPVGFWSLTLTLTAKPLIQPR